MPAVGEMLAEGGSRRLADVDDAVLALFATLDE
jgi:hypothetical protein